MLESLQLRLAATELRLLHSSTVIWNINYVLVAFAITLVPYFFLRSGPPPPSAGQLLTLGPLA